MTLLNDTKMLNVFNLAEYEELYFVISTEQALPYLLVVSISLVSSIKERNLLFVRAYQK